MSKLRLGVLVSGSGTNLTAIMNACKSGTIDDGEVVFVGSDNPDSLGRENARKAGIPTKVFLYDEGKKGLLAGNPGIQVPEDYDVEDTMRKMGSHAKFLGKCEGRDRAIIERQILDHLKGHRVDLLVLAGFMRIITPYLIDRFNVNPARPRIMNIHPALLPSFPGTNGYEDTFNHGCWVFGSTVHFTDYGEDTGPIIGQVALQRRLKDTIEDVKKRGLEAEWKLFPRCIQLQAKGRLKVVTNESGKKVVKISKR